MSMHLEAELARLRSRYDTQPSGRIFAPLADCYRRLGRLDEALDVCLEGLTKHPAYSTAHVILGKVHRDRREPEAALRVFEKVVELDDMNLLALRECATLAEELGEVRRAYEHWNRLLAADPDGEEAEAAIERLAESPQLAAPMEAVTVLEPEARQPSAPPESPPPLEATLEALQESDAVELPPEPEEGAPEETQQQGEAPEAGPSQLDERGIATITLAKIYYDQGFKAKALDVYERVLAENPGDAELARRVETIRAELEQLESHAEDAAPILEGAAPPSEREKNSDLPEEEADLSREVDALTASIEAADSESRDYSQFRSWLSRVKDDEDE